MNEKVITTSKTKLVLPITFEPDERTGNLVHSPGAPFDGENYLLKTSDGWQEGYWIPPSVSHSFDGADHEGFSWYLCDGTEIEFDSVTAYCLLPDQLDEEPFVPGFLSGIRSAASMLFYKACNNWKPVGHPLHQVCLDESKLQDRMAEDVLELEPTEYAKWKEINKLSADIRELETKLAEALRWKDAITIESNRVDSDYYADDPEKTILCLVEQHPLHAR